MTLGVHPEPKEHHRRNQYQQKSTGDTVRNLDDGLEHGLARDNLAITQWPMIAAASPRTRCSDESAPENHHHGVPEYHPHIALIAFDCHIVTPFTTNIGAIVA